MSAAPKILRVGDKMDEAKKGDQVKKLNFTPPILHKYGEIVKICQAQTTQGQQDFYTSSS